MNKRISLEGLPLDINTLIKKLKKDMRDDWFPDSLFYEDTLNGGMIFDYFNKYQNTSTYYLPSISEQFNIPKQGFSLRYSLETNIYDRIVYQHIIDYLIPHYDNLLPECAFSHRWNKGKQKDYIFKQPIDQWKEFELSVKYEMENTHNVLLVCDILNFYENIHIDDIKNMFESNLNLLNAPNKESERIIKAVDLLTRLLRKWTPYKDHGIPQNRDASSFIANMLLLYIDNKMLEKGYKYFRYMDDIRVICDDIFDARRALKELIILLRDINLNVNSQKTKILTYDDERITEYIHTPNRLIEQIDELWKSKRLANIQKSLPMIHKLTLKKIEDNRTQDREFRFCLFRLERIARCREIKENFDFEGITDRIVDELIHQPYTSDILIRYLKCMNLSTKQLSVIANIVTDDHRNIYSWQSYQLWQLFVYHNYCTRNLLRSAKRKIKIIAELNIPDIAGSILYIGACGSEKDKIMIAKGFSAFSKSNLLMRNALLAIHELNFSDYIKDDVKPYVTDETKGIYRRLSNDYKGHYFTPIEPLKPSDIYNDIPDYF
jgi:hypothetical protein